MGKTIDLEYPRAPLWKRVFAFLFDFLCAAVLTTALAAGGSNLLDRFPFYQQSRKTMDEVELASGLYQQSDDHLFLLCDSYSAADSSRTPTEADYQTRANLYENALTSFYSNSLFFSGTEGTAIYNGLKTGTTIALNGASYFEYQNIKGQSVIAKRNDITYTQLNDFYVKCLTDYAAPQISLRNESYLNASRTIFWSVFLLVYLLAVVSLFLFYVVVPLFFKRGRQTFGKKLFRLAVLNAQALPPKGWQFWLRSLILLLVEFVVSSLSFGLPFLVSFTLVATRRDAQAFHDYVAGTYVVDAADSYVYLSYQEFEERNQDLAGLQLKDAEEVSTGTAVGGLIESKDDKNAAAKPDDNDLSKKP